MKKAVIGTFAFILICTISFFAYVQIYYKAEARAISQLKSNEQVNVQINKHLLFEPKDQPKNTGFIFYPGAKVEGAAYSPLAQEIAKQGYPVIIADLRFRLAILSPNRAEDIISEHPEIDQWVIGGHSLGGVMASDYVLKDKKVKGLVLLASYPQKKINLAHTTIETLSIWGSNDLVANQTKIEQAKDMMPNDAEFIKIEGGNHAGFGQYGKQKGDGDASITNEEQIKQTAEHIIQLLKRVEEK